MLGNYVPSLIRTFAAALVGWLLTLPLARPVLVALGQSDADPAAKEKWVAALTVVLGVLYYAVVRALEQRWPKLTVLLGSSKQPAIYAPAPGGIPAVAGASIDPFTAGQGAVPVSMPLNPATISQPSPGPVPVDPDPFMEGGGANSDDGSPASSGGRAPSTFGDA